MDNGLGAWLFKKDTFWVSQKGTLDKKPQEKNYLKNSNRLLLIYHYIAQFDPLQMHISSINPQSTS